MVGGTATVRGRIVNIGEHSKSARAALLKSGRAPTCPVVFCLGSAPRQAYVVAVAAAGVAAGVDDSAGAAKRYPTPGSVRISFGCEGSSSIFWRRYRM